VRQGHQGVFAPTTGALAYITEGQGRQKPTRLWVAGTKGRHRHVLATLTQGVPSEDVLTWSPNGRSIAYMTDTGRIIHPGVSEKGTRTLWVAGAVTHRPRPLVVALDGVLLSPGWSRDGGRIAYLATAACPCRGTANHRVDAAVSVVNVRTGAHQLVLHPAQTGARVFKGSRFEAVAWVTP
jgi:Tol biopolymer transport system component